MAKRGASAQITREGGGEAGSDEEEVEQVEAKAPPPERRVIRGLPARKTANPALASPSSATSTPPPSISAFGSPAAGFGAPPKNPFGGIASAGFSFGSASNSPAAPPPASTEKKDTPLTDAPPPSNPFAKLSNPFSSIPVPGAPKPAAATPFSFTPVASPSTTTTPASTTSKASPFAFGSATVAAASSPKPSGGSSLFSLGSSAPAPASPFSFGSTTVKPTLSTTPSSAAIPPPPKSDEALPWGSTPSLPGGGDKGDAPKSLDADKGGPVVGEDKPKKDDAASIVSQGAAPSTNAFSFGTKPVASVVPPPPAAALSWGNTPILPGDKAGEAPQSLDQSKGGPVVGQDKADAEMTNVETASQVAQPASTPVVEKDAISFGRPTLNGRKSSFGSKSTTMPPPPFPSASSTTANETAPSLSTEYYLNLRGLNVSLVSLLESLVAKDPFLDLSRTLGDLAHGYESKRAELTSSKADAAGGGPSSSSSARRMSSAPSALKSPPKPSPPPKASQPPPPKPLFESAGGFSFGGKKIDVAGGEKAAGASTSPFGGFPSSGGAGAGGGFAFGSAKPNGEEKKKTDSGAPSKPPAFGFTPAAPSLSTAPSSSPFSFGTKSAATTKEGDKTPATKSSAGAFLTSVLSTPPAATIPAEAPKSNGGLFSFSSPSSSATPAAASAPTPASPFSFGSSSTSAAPPPSFNRLSSGTPNFAFGGAPKRSVSSSSFGFGEAGASSSAPSSAAPVAAPAPAAATAATEPEAEDAPAPTIPSDPSLLEKGEGEEDEDTHFEAKAMIHRLGDDKKWEKVGQGVLKVKSGGGSGAKGRVLARIEGTGQLLINFAVHGALKPTVQPPKSVMVLGFEGTTPRQFLVRVKDASSANSLKGALDDRMGAA